MSYKWIYQTGFPAKSHTKPLKYRALIGIGGNIGAPLTRFRLLRNRLLKYPNINVHKTSPILKNPPFGYFEQPDFYNAVISVSTNFAPLEFLNRLLHIERSLGRKRTFCNAPRKIDLDVIFFENIMLYNKRLIIPHPQWSKRISVLAPLAKLRYGRKWRV